MPWTPRHTEVPLAVQAHALKRAQPDSVCRFSGRNKLVWQGHLQPTPFSAQHMVRVDYKLGYHPKTKVLDPPLERREGKPIPHMYGQKTLCLYRPSKLEWNTSMFIADTILPWASLWLFYYEFWCVTGEWLGGGEHPVEKSDPATPAA